MRFQRRRGIGASSLASFRVCGEGIHSTPFKASVTVHPMLSHQCFEFLSPWQGKDWRSANLPAREPLLDRQAKRRRERDAGVDAPTETNKAHNLRDLT